jgi:hypothetical protein
MKIKLYNSFKQMFLRSGINDYGIMPSYDRTGLITFNLGLGKDLCVCIGDYCAYKFTNNFINNKISTSTFVIKHISQIDSKWLYTNNYIICYDSGNIYIIGKQKIINMNTFDLNDFLCIKTSNSVFSFNNVSITSIGDILYINIKIPYIKYTKVKNAILWDNTNLYDPSIYDTTIYKIDINKLYTTSKHTTYDINAVGSKEFTSCTDLFKLDYYKDYLICIGWHEVKIINTMLNTELVIKLPRKLIYNLKPYIIHNDILYILDKDPLITGSREIFVYLLKYDIHTGVLIERITIGNIFGNKQFDFALAYNYNNVSLHIYHNKYLILLYDDKYLVFDLIGKEIILTSTAHLFHKDYSTKLFHSELLGEYLYVYYQNDICIYKLCAHEYNKILLNTLCKYIPFHVAKIVLNFKGLNSQLDI